MFNNFNYVTFFGVICPQSTSLFYGFSGITRPTLYKLHLLTFQNISRCSMSSVIKKKMLAYKCDVFFVAYVTVTPSIIDINFVMFQ